MSEEHSFVSGEKRTGRTVGTDQCCGNIDPEVAITSILECRFKFLASFDRGRNHDAVESRDGHDHRRESERKHIV